ncbi:MAG TPA: PSD1 and planctomycete cytochrome C domain-containing protein [Gemmataceae bacterium]|nr:PSD1 and planctomycete cytochrome C domain-containing protein [Gemmataceae bacterium]
MRWKIGLTGLAGLSALAMCGLPGSHGGEKIHRAPVEFNRDIRPILSNTCFVCHGPDNNLRKAKLRLDQEKDVLKKRGDYSILVPGKPEKSELYLRISHADVKQRMPPTKHRIQLNKEQIELIRRWIEEGGKYENHWSLIAAKRPAPPETKNQTWARNAIDRFVLARLEREGMQPSPQADKRTLIRRLAFDLTGLPPSPKEVDAFLADNHPEAYEKLVERLLRSPQFGERMALVWLDLVRFADTAGYHSDNHRDIYLYRDYVINSFNENKPFDKFTIEQLAGDLLPGASSEQKIASGYNRLLQTTEEGGAQPKEYTAKYAADRVRNAGSVWLGMTLGCAECHDHKFDPVTTKEFYRFGAFFADVQEIAVGRQVQTPLPSPKQQTIVKTIESQISLLQQVLSKTTPQLEADQVQWEASVKGGKGLPKEIAALLAMPADKRNPQQKQLLASFYRSNIAPALKEQRQQLANLQKQKADIQKAMPSTLISMAGPPRTMRVLRRGNWLDDSGEVVTPDIPSSLPPLKEKKARPNRLDLARWLVAPENPLTARVFVNRLWLMAFGQGLVRTPDDFGSQGAWPTHPELLDWLAVEFRESGWDVKRMIRLMVTSSAYRQSSHVTEAERHKDPYNLFLGRQARYRLEAEMVRDNALAISGLLVRKIGGPSVKPYQPAGYWQHLNFPKRDYFPDKGENQYRRGLYTYWQRSFLHPSLLAFDAPSREECTVQRPRSNTPLQALVLLNDPTYVEAARAFAENVIRAGKSSEARIQFAFKKALSRQPSPAEVKLLTDLANRHGEQYRQDAKAADALLHVGDRPMPTDIPAPELAAWTSVARVILNLHETITRD